MVIQELKKQTKIANSPLAVIQYILYLFAKIFLIAIFIIFLSLFVFFVLYFGDLLINVKNGNNKVPLFSAYVIVSPSMVPTIRVNDAIVIKRVDKNSLEVGDIITFYSNDPNYTGLTVTHRIVGKQLSQSGEYVYRTKGDNNNTEDSSLVREKDVYGKVLLKIPKIGYVQRFVSSPFGFLLSIVVPIVLVIISNVLHIYKMVNKQEELEII